MTKSSKRRDNKTKEAMSPRSAPAEAKIFMTGRSQAVRLPKEYRFIGDSVHIRRFGSAIVLTPKTGDRWAGLFAALDEFPRDFTLERSQSQPDRPGLTELFEKPKE